MGDYRTRTHPDDAGEPFTQKPQQDEASKENPGPMWMGSAWQTEFKMVHGVAIQQWITYVIVALAMIVMWGVNLGLWSASANNPRAQGRMSRAWSTYNYSLNANPYFVSTTLDLEPVFDYLTVAAIAPLFISFAIYVIAFIDPEFFEDLHEDAKGRKYVSRVETLARTYSMPFVVMAILYAMSSRGTVTCVLGWGLTFSYYRAVIAFQDGETEQDSYIKRWARQRFWDEKPENQLRPGYWGRKRYEERGRLIRTLGPRVGTPAMFMYRQLTSDWMFLVITFGVLMFSVLYGFTRGSFSTNVYNAIILVATDITFTFFRTLFGGILFPVIPAQDYYFREIVHGLDNAMHIITMIVFTVGFSVEFNSKGVF